MGPITDSSPECHYLPLAARQRRRQGRMTLRPWFRPAPAAFDFFRAWRRAACRAADLQYGVLLAVPALWACLGAFTSPLGAGIGFLATALFLERRPGRRLVFMASLFAAWSFHPGLPGPISATPTITEEGAPSRLTPSRDPAWRPSPAARRVEGRVRGFPTPAGKPGAGKPGAERPGSGGLAFLLDAERGTWRILAKAPGFQPVPGQRAEVTGR
ncbi:MAG TPA: hypothetical protein VK465_11605, partial [Fibrobacteria bacterium]|nr:hypothetical protein [Fibrobacteria bacterium]